jgi:hypothetical protein
LADIKQMPEFVKAEEVLDEKGKAQVQYFPRFAEDGTYLRDAGNVL